MVNHICGFLQSHVSLTLDTPVPDFAYPPVCNLFTPTNHRKPSTSSLVNSSFHCDSQRYDLGALIAHLRPRKCWIDMSDVSNSTPPNGNSHNHTPTASTPSSSSVGHEATFVRPSDLLRPRAASRPVPITKPVERPIDRDERAGLVSGLSQPGNTISSADQFHLHPLERDSELPKSSRML